MSLWFLQDHGSTMSLVGRLGAQQQWVLPWKMKDWFVDNAIGSIANISSYLQSFLIQILCVLHEIGCWWVLYCDSSRWIRETMCGNICRWVRCWLTMFSYQLMNQAFQDWWGKRSMIWKRTSIDKKCSAMWQLNVVFNSHAPTNC